MNLRQRFGRLMVGVMLVIVMISGARAEVGLDGIGGRVGFVDPDGGDGTFTLGVVADLGTIVEQLAWDASIMYWGTGEEIGAYDYTWTDIAIRSSVRYLFLTEQWRPYAGGGLGIHMIGYEVDGPGGTFDDSESELMLQVVGGVETDLSARWKGALDLQLDFGDVDQTTLQFSFIYMLSE